jgi:P27 family predicted phage terminase small subunit
MAHRGPHPKPLSIATERGSNSFSDRLPPVATKKPPTMPKSLTKAAATFWRKHARELHSAGHLTERDAAAFSRCCALWGQLVELDELLMTDGLILISPSGVQKPHPAVQMRAVAEKQFLQHCQQFSLTPGSRLRIPDAAPKPVSRMRRNRES